ncbi:hypothetical protein [Paraburkholderia youngii]|uniref:hypothetical protein n=1 Tax=Paraburkholderia youngii TaxID=2782701 RepID=UPI003D24FB57
MSTNQAYSRPARLLNGASWVIAVAFALFLNLLGSLVIRDLEVVPAGGPPALAGYTDLASGPARARQARLTSERMGVEQQQEMAHQSYETALSEYTQMRSAFENWVATRRATGNSAIDQELTDRTRALDARLDTVNSLKHKVDDLNARWEEAREQGDKADAEVSAARVAGAQQYERARNRYDMRVFGYRLGLTLPVLVLAVWLFVRYRNARYWPFVYGFSFFALSAFFFELVPYLPTFGGYVRAIVGIALTVFAGVYLLRAFQRYADRKGAEMQKTQTERSTRIAYQKALSAHERKLCPSCDRPTPSTETGESYCVHCGLNIFSVCKKCGHRNFAFYRHCNACGEASALSTSPGDTEASQGGSAAL